MEEGLLSSWLSLLPKRSEDDDDVAKDFLLAKVDDDGVCTRLDDIDWDFVCA